MARADMKQSPAQKKMTWIAEQLLRSDSALRQLLAARKTQCADYDARIRKIRGFQEALYVGRSDNQQLELFKEADLLSPELSELISNPLAGIA